MTARALMKIGVISDTHTNSLDRLPRKLLDELSGTDLIIHAGDYTEKKLLDDLRNLGRFVGVYGNMDSWEIRRELPAIENIDAAGFRIGLNHPAEGGAPFDLEKRLRPKFKEVHVIVYGHSHQTKNEVKDGILYFNPGSATGTFPALKKTFGILYIEKEVRSEIIKL